MKKKVMSALLATTMVATMLVGCGSKGTADAPAADEGKVLNIQAWNEEFKSRLIAHYP